MCATRVRAGRAAERSARVIVKLRASDAMQIGFEVGPRHSLAQCSDLSVVPKRAAEAKTVEGVPTIGSGSTMDVG